MTQVELQIHIYQEDQLLMNPERIKLLKLIQKTGSLLTASKHLGVSYNKAWKLLESMKTASQKPLVLKQRGGKDGGGATLTDIGKLIMDEYIAVEKMVNKFTDKLNTEINF